MVATKSPEEPVASSSSSQLPISGSPSSAGLSATAGTSVSTPPSEKRSGREAASGASSSGSSRSRKRTAAQSGHRSPSSSSNNNDGEGSPSTRSSPSRSPQRNSTNNHTTNQQRSTSPRTNSPRSSNSGSPSRTAGRGGTVHTGSPSKPWSEDTSLPEIADEPEDVSGASSLSSFGGGEPELGHSSNSMDEGDTSGDSSSGSHRVFNNTNTPNSLTATISRGHFHQCGTARRVKVYELQGEIWFDRGTGYCAGVYDEAFDEALLVARMETNCVKLKVESDVDEASHPENAAAAAGPVAAASSAEGQTSVTDGEDKDHFVLVVSENLETEDMLLNTRVVREDVYQRQQDTLVVWTEPDGTDMALSFQEADGCNEVWDFLTEVQKHFITHGQTVRMEQQGVGGASGGGSDDEGVLLGMDATNSSQDGATLFMADGSPFALPDPQRDNLETVEVTLKDGASRTAAARGKVAEWLFKDEYVRKLIPVFHDAEELEQLEDLHRLCSITQTILMLNDNVLVESILQDDVFLDVMGMLEYDPEFPQLKASYRDYLINQTRFRQVVPIHDATILAKIHQTFRLLYLKDVILTRIVDDSTFAILNSLIFYHQADIVNFCSTSEQFLTNLFGIFGDPPPSSQHDTSGDIHVYDDEKKSEAVIFIQQLVSMGKQIQLPTRIALYRVLTEWGLLVVLEYALSREDGRLRNAATEVLLTIIEYDATAVRIHISEQVERSRTSLLSKLINLLHEETDLGLKTQLTEALRILFDSAPDGTSVGPGVAQSLSAAAAAAAAAHGDSDGETIQKEDSDRFLAWFYEEEVEHLFEPLKQLPRMKELVLPASSAGQGRKRSKLSLEPRAKSALIGHLCDLLTYIVIHHSYRSQYWIVSSDISARVGALLSAREKHIKLSALRFFRACLTRTNQFVNRHLVKLNVFDSILYLMEVEESRGNLVASACLDLFEFIRKENIRSVLGHLYDRFKKRLEVLAARPTCGSFFTALIEQAGRNKEAPTSQDAGAAANAARGNASAMSVKEEAERKRRIRDLERRGQNRAVMDLDEENYFGEEEEEEENDEDDKNKASSLSASSSFDTASALNASSAEQLMGIKRGSTGPGAGGLVPYSDDDGEEEAQEVASSLPSLQVNAVSPSSQDTSSPVNFLNTPPDLSVLPAAHVQPMMSSSVLEEVAVPKLSGARRKRDAAEGQGEDDDDDDDMMGRLAKRKSLRKGGDGQDAALKMPKEEDSAGGFLKAEEQEEQGEVGAKSSKESPSSTPTTSIDEKEKVSGNGAKKKLSISLSSSSERMIKSDDDSNSTKEETSS